MTRVDEGALMARFGLFCLAISELPEEERGSRYVQFMESLPPHERAYLAAAMPALLENVGE